MRIRVEVKGLHSEEDTHTHTHTHTHIVTPATLLCVFQGIFECVAECCRVLQSVAVCCSVLQCVAERGVAECCRHSLMYPIYHHSIEKMVWYPIYQLRRWYGIPYMYPIYHHYIEKMVWGGFSW